jgi:hypothetical protein
MFAAVIVIGSCSRSSNPVAVQQPVQPTAPVSAPTVNAPAPTPAPVVAKAKPKKHRAATLSYVNREYGLSFNFPRNYQLKTAPAAAEQTTMNFVHPGGVALVTLELPGNSYPGTDFKSGSANVSVNPGMTSEACAQFASPEPSTETGTSTQAKVEQVKFGTLEFNEVENTKSAMMKQADAKYYHVFNNGTCYEFVLQIGTDNDGHVEEVTPVDRTAVFGQLEKILATVKFQPTVLPETHVPEEKTSEAHAPEAHTSEIQAPVPAVAASKPTDTSSTPEQPVPAPNF